MLEQVRMYNTSGIKITNEENENGSLTQEKLGAWVLVSWQHHFAMLLLLH
jgi:hypothetical protein